MVPCFYIYTFPIRPAPECSMCKPGTVSRAVVANPQLRNSGPGTHPEPDLGADEATGRE
jgi:hypothetical protein